MNPRLTISSPSVVAVYLTVPTQFVHWESILEWVQFRRKLSKSGFWKVMKLLVQWGFIERKHGSYRLKLAAPQTK